MSALLFGFLFSIVYFLLLAYGASQLIKLTITKQRSEHGKVKKLGLLILLLLKTGLPLGSIYYGIVLFRMSGWLLAAGAFLGMTTSLWIIHRWIGSKRNRYCMCENGFG